jgi:hypothetical protein
VTRPNRPSLLLALATALGARAGIALAQAPAEADQPVTPPVALPLVHPIFVHMPDAPDDDLARREFTAATSHYGLYPVEVIDVPAPAPPHAAEALKSGITKATTIAFADALKDLDAAAAEVATTGGAGLSTTDLSDLYLYRAMASAGADWNAQAGRPPGAEAGPRAKAYADYLRAATIAPTRTLSTRELPPQVIADFGRAAEEVRGGARGTLTVRGPAGAQLSLDGGTASAVAGGVTFRDLPYGEHFVHVDEIGRAPWGTVVNVGAPTQELEIPPSRVVLSLDDGVAAAHARRMGARFALLGEPKPGPGNVIELRLIDGSGTHRDAARVSITEEHGGVDAAVMRLDEQARRLQQAGQAGANLAAAPPAASPPVLLAAPPAKARFRDDPAAWARDHWPLLTAAGVLLGTAVVLGITVAADH